MNTYNKQLHRHSSDFYLFYFLLFLGAFPAIENLLLLVAQGQFNSLFYFIGSMIILLGGCISVDTSIGKIKPIIIVIGIITVLLSIPIKIFINQNTSVKIIELLIVIYTIWVAIISYCTKKHLTHNNKLLKYIIKIWVCFSVILFIIVKLIIRNNYKAIDIILHKGSYFVEGGLNSKQIDALIDTQKLYSMGYIAGSVLTFAVIFLIFYSRKRNEGER